MEIKIYKKHWELEDVFTASYGEIKGGANIYIQLIDDDGFCGWGEAAPLPTEKKGTGVLYSNSFERVLSDLMYLADKQLSSKDISFETLKIFHKEFGHLSPEAVCAMDLAICDLLSRRKKIPVIELFENKNKNIDSTFSFSIGSTDSVTIRQQTEKAVEWGIIKYKISNNINLIPWDLLSGKTLIFDFDGVYNDFNKFKKEIIESIPNISHRQIILEEPFHFTDDNKELAKLFDFMEDKNNVSIIFDDSVDTIEDVLKINSVFPKAGFNIKLQKMGGLYPSVEIIKNLRESNVLMFGSLYETSLSISAAAQLKYILSTSIDDLDADIYTGIDEKSPTITPEGRFVKSQTGIGYEPNISNLEEIKKHESR